LGHSYYGDNRAVLSDLFHVLKANYPPEERQWLARRGSQQKPYWVFHKTPPEIHRPYRGSEQLADGDTPTRSLR
jgi:hypothetical protein